MDAFEIEDLIAERAASESPYLEFLRIPEMSLGIYSLLAGATDHQSPHGEDEAYYVVRGRGAVHVGGEDRDIQPGSVVFVGRNVEHRFHSITEDLELVVFFAPAEGS